MKCWKKIEWGVWKRDSATIRAAAVGYTWRVFGVAFGVAGTLRAAKAAADG